MRDSTPPIVNEIATTLQESEQRFAAIFHSAMDAIIAVDNRQNIVLFNPAAEEMFRCKAESAIGAPLSQFIPERFRDRHHRHVDHFGETGISDQQISKQRSLYALRADGSEFPMEASISQATQNGSKLYTVMLRDITARRHAEAALRESEERYRGLVEISPDAIYVHQDAKIVFANKAALELFGASSPEQFIGKSLFELFHPDSHAAVRELAQALYDGAPAVPSVERKILRFDGTVRFVDIAVSACEYGGKPALQGTMRDVTGRRQAQDELQRSHFELQQLTAALETAQEVERKRIARDLHDDLGQILTVLKIDLSNIKSKLGGQPVDQVTHTKLVEDIARVDGLLDQTVQSLRRISADLRPMLLDDLGLVTALEALVHQVRQRSRISCSLEINLGQWGIDEYLATPLYRVAQEALNNVVKHAHATEAKLHLFHDATGNIVLEVRDNGKGIEPADRRKANAFGLIGMRERIQALHGELLIDSTPGAGTAIRIAIPANEKRGSA